MKEFERRVFLTRGSIAVAAIGAATAMPGLGSGLIAAEEEAPEAASVVEGEASEMTEPLVAHVRDLTTGEIGLFSGTQEIVFHDPALAARLFHATR
jgi:hypothetical protein